MPNIKPVSDLRKYNDVLKSVGIVEPVFLTKNGRGRYALMDMADYEKTEAALKRMTELARDKKANSERERPSPKESSDDYKKAAYDFIASNHTETNELTAEDFAEFESGKYRLNSDRRALDL